MTLQGRWISGLFIVAAPFVAFGILRPLFHRPGEIPPGMPRRQASLAPNSVPPRSEVASDTLTLGETAAPGKKAVSVGALLPQPQPPQDRRIEDWKKNFPSSALPYDLVGGGSKPGPSPQKLGAFLLSAQASDTANPFGQTPVSPAEKHRPVMAYLTVKTSQPISKTISWELVENGLTAEGELNGNSGVSTTGLLPAKPAGQAASITQSPYIIKNRHPKYIIIRGYLRQAENYEELLTFHTPAVGIADQTAQSQETPSGVTVTLPPQAMTVMGGSGESSDFRLSFSVSPAQTPATLPNSPLFQKYHRPVLLRVGAATPTGNAYDYPFSDLQHTAFLYKQPNQPWQYGPSPDVLTLVVQQRVYLQDIPFALKVPVSHQPFNMSPYS